jgi:hypothetical protein
MYGDALSREYFHRSLFRGQIPSLADREGIHSLHKRIDVAGGLKPAVDTIKRDPCPRWIRGYLDRSFRLPVGQDMDL